MNRVDLVEVRSGRFCPIARTFCCCPFCSDEFSFLRVSPRTSKGQICCRGFFFLDLKVSLDSLPAHKPVSSSPSNAG